MCGRHCDLKTGPRARRGEISSGIRLSVSIFICSGNGPGVTVLGAKTLDNSSCSQGAVRGGGGAVAENKSLQ